MAFDLNDVTPQDKYLVKLTGYMDTKHISYLLDFYQPIIGTNAVSFYLTLVNHMPFHEVGYSELKLHRSLLTKTALAFNEIIKTRKILEAIGLLQTIRYKHKENEDYIYEYNMILPLTPNKFIRSDILSILLLNRLGKTEFERLKERYFAVGDWNHDEYLLDTNMTKSFDEVFNSVLASELQSASSSEIYEMVSTTLDKSEEAEKSDVTIKNKYLDIDFIKGMVSDIFQLHRSLDGPMVKLLNEMAFLYQLKEVDIIHLLKDHSIYNEAGNLDEQLFKSRCREKYQYQQKEVKIVNREQNFKKVDLSGKSKAEKHKWVLENLSPIELFKHYQKGGKASETDLVIIEELIHSFKLPLGVVNVLIEYVLLTYDYDFPKNLVEKIAAHWKRLDIKTVEEAQDVAKKRHNQYVKWKDPKTKESPVKKAKTTNGKTKKEKIPDYILQQDEKYHQNQSDPDLDEASKEEINRLLKELGEL